MAGCWRSARCAASSFPSSPPPRHSPSTTRWPPSKPKPCASPTPLPPRRLANLAAAGADFAAATEPADRLCADAAFHDLVCAPFAGTPAGQLLLDLKVRTLFYERAYLREAELFDASVASHAEVVDGLRDDDLPLAVIALRQNWLNVVELLDARLAASAAQPSPLSPTRP